ncbi:MAG: hypothetical protein KF902_15255 [Phycisphaeraceae bacterium]|nr:hypothetical protein [Phycisphaeraceae bacterium]
MPTEANIGTTQGGWNAGSFGGVPLTDFAGPLYDREHFTISENMPVGNDAIGLAVIEGGGGGLPFGNGLSLFFFGGVGASPGDNTTATLRIWAVSDAPEVPKEPPDPSNFPVYGFCLGDVKLTLGQTPGLASTPIPAAAKFFCDAEVIQPDTALTPPGIRVIGRGAEHGKVDIFFDTVGCRAIIIQIMTDDATKLESMFFYWRVL